MADRWVRAFAANQAVRVIAVDAAEIARQTAQRHGLDAGAARLGAEIAVASMLLGAHIKGSERVTLQLQAEHPRASAVGEISADGRFRGRVSPATIPDVVRRRGVLLAIKADVDRELYRGLTAVEDETVAAALDRHLRDSAQVDASLAIDVAVDAGGVARAAGLLVERMAADPARVSMDKDTFRDWYANLGASDVADALAGTLRGEPLEILAEDPLVWSCGCSADKVADALIGLGPDALRQMREEDGGAEVTCHFCRQVYRLDEDKLVELEALARIDARRGS